MPELAGIKLQNNIFTISGPPDTGKSNLAKYLLTLEPYRSHLVYDPLFGFDPERHNVIRPPREAFKYAEYEEGNPELNKAARLFVTDAPPKRRPTYFLVDEAGALLPNQKPMGAAMGHLSMFNAHMGVSVGLIFQRFAEVNTDFTEKATHHFVLGYKGKNDRENLRNLHRDLPDALDTVKPQEGQFGFAYTGPNNTLKTFKPVPEVGEKSTM